MNGAETLMRTLLAGGVDVCFMNPGTSEMHFVAALDTVPEMRPVLGLYEGVVSGAADGYARMAGRPACTLLHLGPGLTNALSNVHNARRARTPMVNVVGDHATYHRAYDAPLTSDIEGLAAPLSDWLRTSSSVKALSADTGEAINAARRAPGHISTLVLPADVAWTEGGETTKPAATSAPPKVDDTTVRDIARVLRRDESHAILIDDAALQGEALSLAGRIAEGTNAKLMCPTFTSRLERGAGRVPVERLPYFPEMISDALEGVQNLVLLGARAPVSFFAYPGGKSQPIPEGCRVHELAAPGHDLVDVLRRLADETGAPARPSNLQAASRPEVPTGNLDEETVARAIGAHLPENAIVADEGNTGGFLVSPFCAGAPPHDWLGNTGGSIGLGMPLATGAAIAQPDRKVICLEGDGSAMYTIQALWTQAREQLDVVTVLLANRAYRILDIELQHMGTGGGGDHARAMLDIDRPTLDFVSLAQSMGVSAERVDTADAFSRAFARAVHEPGPKLIEACL